MRNESASMVLGNRAVDSAMGGYILDSGTDMNEPTSFGNQAPTKVQCAECHWQGLSSELIALLGDSILRCPVCHVPFARYPQKAEHLWSDPY